MPSKRTNHFLRAYQSPSVARKIYALANLAQQRRYQTAADGGEVGIATGFGGAILFRPRSPTGSSFRGLCGRTNGSTTGWCAWISTPANNVTCTMYGSAASQPSASQLTATEFHKLHCFVFQHTGTQVRAVLDTIERSNAMNITGYTVPAASTQHLLGAFSSFSPGANDIEIVAHLTYRGVLSDAQISAFLADVRNLEDFPIIVTGATITHRWYLRDALMNLNVGDGQDAPTSIQDSTTFATISRMDRVGVNPLAPVVRVIDPDIEGRKTKGAAGFGANTTLETAAGAGIQGQLAGFHVAWRGVITTTSGSEVLASCVWGTTGWILYRNGTGLQFVCYTGAENRSSPSYTITTADLNVTRVVHGVLDGAFVRIFFEGVEQGNPGTSISAYAASGSVTAFSWANLPFAGICYELAGGHFVPTAAEIAKNVADTYKRGLLQSIPGKTEHLWRITQDVANDNAIPVTALDRIGTAHMTRYGGWKVANGGLRSGEKQGSATSTYLRTVGSSFPGTTSPWIIEFVWYDDGVTTPDAETFANQSTFDTALGWTITYSNTSQPVAFVAQTTTTKVVLLWTKGSAMAPGVHVATLAYDGSQFVGYVDGVQVVSSATGFVFSPASSEPLIIGGHRASSPLYALKTKSALGLTVYSGLWTPAEIASASAAAISAGKPVGVAGKNTKQWRIPDDVADAGGKVPSFIRERIAGTDHMLTIGAPLQLAEWTDHLWGYETDAVMQRTAELDATSKYIACAGGTSGEHASGMWWAVLIAVLGMTAPTQHFAGKRNSGFTNGWGFSSSLGNQQIIPRISTTGNATLSGPVASVQQTDIGKTFLIGGVLDPIAGVLRTFHKRAEVGAGASLGGTYLPAAAAPCVMGGLLASLGGATTATVAGIRFFGMMCGRGLPSLARWQSAFDACAAREDLIEIPDMTEHLWSVTRSVKENGGAMPSTINDRIGTDHMTVYGGLASNLQLARAFGW